MKLRARQLARAYVEMTDGKSAKEVEKIAAEFVRFLAERHELPKWREIVRSIDDVWRERHGVASVTVISAHPLTTSARKALEKAASGATLTEAVDPSLLGGARVRIDDRIIDATVSGYLTSLKTTLSS
jgi:F-type H+-transporting ATPase subunit delta